MKAPGRQGERNQSRNLLAIWSNWLFAVFAGWEAEHILYGLSCYGGWSHPPILDPCCRSPWLMAPFPCLAFLWSPRGCTPPPWMHTAGGTARGETCLANSGASSGRRRPRSPSTIGPCLCLHPAMLPSPLEVFALFDEGPVLPPRGKRFFSSQRERLSFPWKFTVQDIFSQV